MPEETRLVRFEACCEFAPDEADHAVCEACGWLLEDHTGDAGGAAAVAELPVRASVPVRRAS